MAMLLGKKLGMTQIYDQKGVMHGVTVIQAGPCTVTQVKSLKTDRYSSIQMGFEDVKPSRRTKAQEGHAKKANTTPKKFVGEMRLPDDAEPTYKSGDLLTVAVFEGTHSVDVIGTSKGKGFAGVMKRYHFGGMPDSHGTERKHRSPGSIASHATDRGHGGNLHKGKKMGGHMGSDRVTSKSHRLILVDPKNNLLAVRGSVPGAAGSYVIVRTAQKEQQLAVRKK